MQIPNAADRFAALEHKEPIDEYNLEHFRARHLLQDGKRTLTDRGILPGEVAPDFELPQVGGDPVRLGDLRGQPVILHFGSYS